MKLNIHTKDCCNDELDSSNNYSTANWDVLLCFSTVLLTSNKINVSYAMSAIIYRKKSRSCMKKLKIAK